MFLVICILVLVLFFVSVVIVVVVYLQTKITCTGFPSAYLKYLFISIFSIFVVVAVVHSGF